MVANWRVMPLQSLNLGKEGIHAAMSTAAQMLADRIFVDSLGPDGKKPEIMGFNGPSKDINQWVFEEGGDDGLDENATPKCEMVVLGSRSDPSPMQERRFFTSTIDINTKAQARTSSFPWGRAMSTPKAIVIPALTKHTATVICSHGLGDR